MIIENCLFLKVRNGVSEERIKASLQGNGLDLVVLDGENGLAKFRGSMEKNRLPQLVSRLKNTLLFSSAIFSGSAFVSDGYLSK